MEVYLEPAQDSPRQGVALALLRVAGLAQAYYGGSKTTIGLWSYPDTPLVHEQGRQSTAVPATPAGVPPVVLPKICNSTAPFGSLVRCDQEIWTAGSEEGEVTFSQTMSRARTSPGLVHCIVRALLLSIDSNLQLRSTMLWPRLVFLVLLSLGLVGCWESSTRLSSPPTASSGQYGLHSSAGDDVPTPRFFQIQNWSAPSE
jgi:hypothetical protein